MSNQERFLFNKVNTETHSLVTDDADADVNDDDVVDNAPPIMDDSNYDNNIAITTQQSSTGTSNTHSPIAKNMKDIYPNCFDNLELHEVSPNNYGYFASEKEKFSKKNNYKKNVFIGLKVNDLGDIDDENETFNIDYHIYLNWVPTKSEFDAYNRWNYIENNRKKAFEKCEMMEYKYWKNYNNNNNNNDNKEEEDNNNNNIDFELLSNRYQPLPDWQPLEIPEFEFRNANAKNKIIEWGKFKIGKLKFGDGDDDIHYEYNNNNNNIYFIRVKITISASFDEEYEMQNYPFDCQDLTCILAEKSQRFYFLPELRGENFFVVETSCVEVGDFSMKGAILDIGTIPTGARMKRDMMCIVISLKLQRRYKDVLYGLPLVTMLLSGLSLTLFSIDIEEDSSNYNDRLNFMITLILASLFQGKLKKKPYITLMDCYILCNFVYLVLITIMIAIENELLIKYFDPSNIDRLIFYVWFAIYLLLQLTFMIYSYFMIKKEEKKLFFVHEQIIELNGDRPQVHFSYKTFGSKINMDIDENNILHSYFGALSTSKKIDKNSFKNSYEQQRSVKKEENEIKHNIFHKILRRIYLIFDYRYTNDYIKRNDGVTFDVLQ